MPNSRGPIVDLSAFDGAAFDLDGVITQTASVHAAAWKQLFDDFLASRAPAGQAFVPFDIEGDYLRHVDGKPRYDGVRDFLASRGIALPEGAHDDPPERETVHGLGNRKNALFRESLAKLGVQVFEGSVDFLRRLRRARIRIAVVSSSENTRQILEVAGLGDLFDVRVDGVEAARLGLKGKPSADTFLYAAGVLGVAPERMLGVEDSLAGVEAIRAAGFGLVIGVDRKGQAAALASHGAGMVVADLGVLRVQADLHLPSWTGESFPAGTFPTAPGTDPQWLLLESGFTLAREHEVESLFAIGNGNLGSRGSLAEGSRLSAPATFVAGVFDSGSGDSLGLAGLADWTHASVSIEGQVLSLQSGCNLVHRRILDLRQAVVFREWRHRDAAGRVTCIRGFRLASAADRRLLIQSIAFLPENYSATVVIDATIAPSTTRTTTTGVALSLAASTRLTEFGHSTPVVHEPVASQSLDVGLGSVYRFDRVVAVHTSRDPGDPERLAREHVEQAGNAGVAALVDAHVRAWKERWDACDIRIDGDPDAQRALRFAIYHLLSAANPDDARASIGARGMTGPAYKGHVFWDTEIFMLPFFTLTYPRAASALLRYRHHTLPAARQRAALRSRRGAMYAWESADSGEDVTPPAVIQPDGAVVPVRNGEQEIHISGDIAFAVWNYWRATGDSAFLLEAGAEILLETARFWASRVEPGEDGQQHIRGIIGPDEYHERVDDNAYTNALARWNLETGARTADLLGARWPQRWRQLSAGLGLEADEPRAWRSIAGGMYTGLNPDTGLIEQFRGYFDLEDIDLADFRHRNAPMDVLLGRERLQRSQIIKQPDVVMLLHLFWDDYEPHVREANFRYYEPRCAHGSSLSPAIHALVAAKLGDAALATRYLQQAMDIDLADNMGNAAGGVHLGALGGLWQAVVFGFGGVRLTDSGPVSEPHLPSSWNALSMRLLWQGLSHDLHTPGASSGSVRNGEDKP